MDRRYAAAIAAIARRRRQEAEGAPPPEPFSFADDFNRANGALTAPWEQLVGSIGIVGTQVDGLTNGPGGYALAAIEAAVADVDLTLFNIWTNNVTGIAFRIESATDFLYLIGHTSALLDIRHRTGVGSEEVVGSLPQALADNRQYRVRVVGDQIEVYHAGVLVDTVTSAVNQSATKHGLFSFSGGGGWTADNFTCTEV